MFSIFSYGYGTRIPKKLGVLAAHGDGESPKTLDARYVENIKHYFDNPEKAINKDGHNGRGWHMLAVADLYPYNFEDAVRHLDRIFAVTNQGTCFIWMPSYGTGDNKRNALTVIRFPNDTPLFCRDQASPDQNQIADPGCACASVIRSNLEPCS